MSYLRITEIILFYCLYKGTFGIICTSKCTRVGCINMNSGSNSMQRPVIVRQNPVNVVLAAVITFSLMVFFIAAQLTYTIIESDVIYRGVEINGNDIANMSKGEAKLHLGEIYGSRQLSGSLTVNIEDYSKSTTYNELGVFYDIDRYVEEAYSTARKGSLARRLYDSLVTAHYGKTIEMKPIFNKQKLLEFIEEIYEDTLIMCCNPYTTIADTYVKLNSGYDGRSIERDSLYSTLEPIILIHKDASIEIPVLKEQRTSLDVEDIYKRIIKEPVNATTKVENNIVIIIPPKEGKTIDKDKLIQAVNELAEENVEKRIPVKFIKPDITAEEVRELIFKDNLSSVSTQFETSTENGRNRSINIELGVSKINGIILEPGEIFSFNEIVGPRDETNGYQTANVYMNGEVIDGIGGGICQVSSTLYNAVIYAGLEVVERKNHMFTVSYVPPGRDATVAYGEIDFKFRNSTDWPIRLDCNIKNSDKITDEITFDIIGTNSGPNKIIRFETDIRETTNYKTVYIEDPELPEGYTEIKHSGHNGLIVDTYMCAENANGEKDRKLLHTSIYHVLDEQIIKGTKKPPLLSGSG